MMRSSRMVLRKSSCWAAAISTPRIHSDRDLYKVLADGISPRGLESLTRQVALSLASLMKVFPLIRKIMRVGNRPDDRQLAPRET